MVRRTLKLSLACLSWDESSEKGAQSKKIFVISNTPFFIRV